MINRLSGLSSLHLCVTAEHKLSTGFELLDKPVKTGPVKTENTARVATRKGGYRLNFRKIVASSAGHGTAAEQADGVRVSRGDQSDFLPTGSTAVAYAFPQHSGPGGQLF